MSEAKKRPPITARSKMMDYLARRDHSELELRQKLSRKFSEEQIAAALTFGKKNGWIADGDEATAALSTKVAGALGRKYKGIRFINSYLSQRGLPEVKMDQEQELAKALALVKNKFSLPMDLEFEEIEKRTAKLSRFLMARGFDTDVIRKVIEECKN